MNHKGMLVTESRNEWILRTEELSSLFVLKKPLPGSVLHSESKLKLITGLYVCKGVYKG